MSSQNTTVAPTELGLLSHEEIVKVGRMPEGYDEYFDPPLESKFKCPICLLGLREPVQTSCGHRFCRSCIVHSIRDDDPICPVDNEPLSESQIYPDKFAEREMKTFLVFCRAKKQNGCLWKGTLTKLEDHLNECPFILVDCTNDCGMQLQQKDLQQHMSTECLLRKTPCDYCDDAVLWNEVEKHFESCSKYPQPCDKCKEEGIERDKMKIHLERDCPNVKIKCPLNILGCQFEGLRSHVNKHMNEQLCSHMVDLVKVGVGSKHVRDRTKGDDDSPQKQAVLEGSLIRQLQEEMEKLKRAVHHLEHQLREAQMRHERPVHEQNIKLLQYEGRFCNGMYTWRIENFTQCCQDAISGACTAKYSPAFYTSLRYGYKLCMRINLNGVDNGVGKHIALFVHLMQGDYDDFLEWPFSKKFRLSIMDQSDDEESHCHISKRVVAEPQLSAWTRPMAPHNYYGFGYQEFAAIEIIHKPQYMKNNTLLVKFEIIG